MAEPNTGPPGGGSAHSTRVPNWMLGPDDLGETRTLLLRAKSDETLANEAGSDVQQKTEKRLPANPFLIAQTVQLAVGHNEAKNVHASKEARGSRYVLRTSSKSVAEKLMGIKTLTDGTPVEVVLHPTLSYVQGILYDLDTIDQEETYIQQQLAEQGVTKVRRIKKRVGESLKNTPLLILTFQAVRRPEFIYVGLLRTKVRPYYPSPMLCFRCAEYGHGKARCTAENPVCLRCSQAHTVADNEKCSRDSYCLHCKQAHPPISRECPKYKSEEAIIKLKTDRGITFAEARAMIGEGNKAPTFTSMVQNRLNREMDEKDRTIEILREELAAVRVELRKLQEVLYKQGRNTHQPILPGSVEKQSMNMTVLTSNRQRLSPGNSAANSTFRQNETDSNILIRLSRKDSNEIQRKQQQTPTKKTSANTYKRNQSQKRSATSPGQDKPSKPGKQLRQRTSKPFYGSPDELRSPSSDMDT